MTARALRVATFAVLVAAVARPAAADWLFTPFVGITFKGDTTFFEAELEATSHKHWNFGGAATLTTSTPFGAEAYFVYTPSFFRNGQESADSVAFGAKGSQLYALMGNFVVTTPKRWRESGLRPFVSAGAGFIHAAQTDKRPEQFLTFSRNLPALNVGGGAIGVLSDRTGVRFDLRYIGTFKDVDEDPNIALGGRLHLRYWTTSIGVVLRY
jgi:hypothetical protein